MIAKHEVIPRHFKLCDDDLCPYIFIIYQHIKNIRRDIVRVITSISSDLSHHTPF